MSWKSVEMQIALPRTVDAGRIQDRMQQQGKLVQEQLAKDTNIIEEQKRQKVNEYSQKDNVRNKDQEGMTLRRLLEKSEQSAKPESMKVVQSNHPYLGKQIDFNG